MGTTACNRAEVPGKAFARPRSPIPMSFLVHKGKGETQGRRNGGSTLAASCIWRYYDAATGPSQVALDEVSLANKLDDEAPAKEIVYGDVEEPLELGIVQVHGDDVVCACKEQKLGQISYEPQTFISYLRFNGPLIHSTLVPYPTQ